MKTSLLRLIALLVLLPLLARGQFNGGGSFNPGPTNVPVTKITAGAGISLSPSTGTGTVQITATGTAPSIAAYSVLSNSTSGAATAVGNTTLVVGAPTPSVTSNGGILITSFALTSAQQGNLYAEFAIQGQNAGAAASTDYIAYADNATSTTHFVDMGINSSGYAAGGSSIFPFVANAGYVFTGNDDLYVGTLGANTLHLYANAVDYVTVSSAGLTSVIGKLYRNGNVSAVAWGNGSPSFEMAGNTLTDTSSSGTVATAMAASFRQVSFAANSATTYTNAATLFVAVPTTTGGNVTLGSAWSIYTTGGIRVTSGLIKNDDSTNATNASTGSINTAGGLGVVKDTFLTGLLNLSPTARTGTPSSFMTVTTPADTALTANTEMIGVNFVAGTRTWVDGTVALQEDYFFGSNTLNKTTTSATFTLAVGASFGAPVAGSGVTFTNSGAALIRSTANLVFGATALAKINVSADTASGVLTFTAPSTGSFAFTGGGVSMGGTAYSFGALPSGATTTSPAYTIPATTYTVTGTNTATAFQAAYHGVPTFTDASVGTVTDLFSEVWAGPSAVAGSLVGTRKHTLGVLDATSASSSIIGPFVVAATFGTTATSTAIGGGNINTGGTLTVGGTTTLTGAATLTAKISTYNNVATAGWGVPAIQNVGRVTAQSAANASIATYTCGAADGTFDVSANMNVTVSTAISTTLTVTYTDESNTARTMILPVQQLTGSFIAGGLISGTGAWETPVMHIRVKASTAITVLTAAGTFTGVTYTAEGRIIQTG